MSNYIIQTKSYEKRTMIFFISLNLNDFHETLYQRDRS